jgi:hypothetical protein
MQQYNNYYSEGFDDDSQDEGFDDDDSQNEGFKSKKSKPTKLSKSIAKSNKAIAKSAKKTGKAIKNSKLGKAVSKAIKKTDKALGISKKAKKFKRAVIDPALILAQTQARIAQEQLKENENARRAAQKLAAGLKSSIEKTVQNPDLKAFNTKKMDVNKSASLIFAGSALVLMIIIYAINSFKYGKSYINQMISDDANKPSSGGIMFNTIVIVLLIAFMAFFSIIFKALILKKDIAKKDVLSIITSHVTIGLPILAITLIIINSLPLMQRSFENTFGYWWIQGSKLKELTRKMFGGENGNYNDYSIIATQINEHNIKAYLTCMKKEGGGVNLPSLNRFPGINLADKFFDKQTGKLNLIVPSESNKDPDIAVLYDFANLIAKKSSIAKAIWMALATTTVYYSVNVLTGNINV